MEIFGFFFSVFSGFLIHINLCRLIPFSNPPVRIRSMRFFFSFRTLDNTKWTIEWEGSIAPVTQHSSKIYKRKRKKWDFMDFNARFSCGENFFWFSLDLNISAFLFHVSMLWMVFFCFVLRTQDIQSDSESVTLFSFALENCLEMFG